MRIEERIGAEAAASQSAAASEAQKIRKPPAGIPGDRSGTGDSTRISTLAGRIRERLDAIGASHAARVEQLAGDVRSGRYRVDVAALGRALASEARGGAEL